MRYVDRTEADMLAAQNELNKTRKYNCAEVKKYLSKTYRGLCAYCETEVETSNYLEVEHLLPKKHYSSLEFDIHNLHLACKRCNNPKGAKTDSILSPNFYLDNPASDPPDWKKCSSEDLSQKIRYRGHLLYSPTNDSMALSTIKILRLNSEGSTDKRERLIESRLRVYTTALVYIKIIVGEIGILAELSNTIRQDLYKKVYNQVLTSSVKISTEALCSMMKHGSMYSQMVIDNFSEPLIQILTLIEALSPSNVALLSTLQIKDIIKKSEQIILYFD